MLVLHVTEKKKTGKEARGGTACGSRSLFSDGLSAAADPAQGTIFPPAWYHTLQPHERMMSAPFALLHLDGRYKTLATTLNYWWVDGTAMPDAENSGSIFMDNAYFEVMTNGNVWLPEDLIQVQAKYSSDPPQKSGGTGAEGMFGTKLGDQLRAWLAKHQRPLVWADRLDGPMLLDPIVAHQLGAAGYGFSHSTKITNDDIEMFRRAWADQPAWNHSFDALVREASPYLSFRWQSFFTRDACAAVEANASNHVMGVDENGECVYWTSPADHPEGEAWECLNDGTCSIAELPSERALFATEEACLSQCGRVWECVRDVPFAQYSGTAYCLPRVAKITPGVCGADGNGATACEQFSSVESCEAGCTATPGNKSVIPNPSIRHWF